MSRSVEKIADESQDLTRFQLCQRIAQAELDRDAAQKVRAMAEAQSLERAKRLDAIRKMTKAQEGETTEAAVERVAAYVPYAELLTAAAQKVLDDWNQRVTESDYTPPWTALTAMGRVLDGQRERIEICKTQESDRG